MVVNVIPALYKAGYSPNDFVRLAQYDTSFAKEYNFASFDIQPLKTIHTALDMLTGKSDERKVFIEPEIVIHDSK